MVYYYPFSESQAANWRLLIVICMAFGSFADTCGAIWYVAASFIDFDSVIQKSICVGSATIISTSQLGVRHLINKGSSKMNN